MDVTDIRDTLVAKFPLCPCELLINERGLFAQGTHALGIFFGMLGLVQK